MLEFEEKFKDEFFIITSNNLNEIESKLYGYAIVNSNIVQNGNFDENLLDGTGCYISISADDDRIVIGQDFNGDYGLYLYRQENYFALSNSFLKLVEYLKDKKDLTLNRELGDSFLFAAVASYSPYETLVNEIELLSRNVNVIIDKADASIAFEEIDYEEHTVRIASQKGIEILDSWFYKWVEVIRNIRLSTNNLSIDLSGGFDSRMVAALWLSANVDLAGIKIKSHERESKMEDFEVASEIAGKFNFTLNNPMSVSKTYFDDVTTPLRISFYDKLGFHKKMYFKMMQFDETAYSFTGEGGGSIRGFRTNTPEEYISFISKKIEKINPSLKMSTVNVLKNTYESLSERTNASKTGFPLTQIHYDESRSRYHFGKSSVESYFSNMVTLTPLFDPLLRKLILNPEYSEHSMLIMALIFVRYCPDLLTIKFEGNRTIPKETIDLAREINDSYPFKAREYEFIQGPEATSKDENEVKYTRADVNGYLKGIFYSKSFESEFKKCYSQDIYNEIIMQHDATPLGETIDDIYSAIAVILIGRMVANKTDADFAEILDEFNDGIVNKPIFIEKEYHEDLLKFITSRVDVKCMNDDTSVEIIGNSDIYSKVSNPDWFKKKPGNGFIVESHASKLDLELKIDRDDEVKFFFRSKNYFDRQKNPFPTYIDYTKIVIDDVNVIDENQLVRLDEPITFKSKFKKSGSIKIHIEWAPFTKDSQFKHSINEMKKIQQENRRLKEEIESIKNTKSWKLMSSFKKSV